MELPKIFEPFIEQSPVPVMARAILAHAFPPTALDALFVEHAVAQYQDELLFSTLFEIAALTVAGTRKSVNASYHSLRERVPVSVTAVYDKLRGTETQVSRALVRDSAARLAAVVERLLPARAGLLPRLRVKFLDGNHLAGTEHRLVETRELHSQPLPGHVLVIFDAQLRLMADVFPCEDAYAQERTLLGGVLEQTREGDCYVADRNFCTTDFLFDLAARRACFVIRQHASTLCGKKLVGRRKFVGPCDGGGVYEQALEVVDPRTEKTLTLRRITVELDQPTRAGDREIHLVSNVSRARVDALRLAAVYRERWTIENAFQELDQALHAEVNTLCYPKAALLCFCIGAALYNLFSVLKAAIEAAHPDAPPLSGYYLAEEASAIYSGMMIAIPPRKWAQTFASLTPRQFAGQLCRLAQHVTPARFRKRQRGIKKPPPARRGGSLQTKHVSTARILLERAK
jgi:IS4 transposase